MPLYDYECQNCKKVFTVTLSLKDHGQGKVVCPACGSTQVEQLISPFIAKTSRKS